MQRPWNKAHEVVYSLSTFGVNSQANMNICTYVVPISMKPKKYMIALDPSTFTYQNFMQSEYAVLQILSPTCKKYVSTLGKKTGKNTDKLLKLQKDIGEYRGFPVLVKASAYLYVQKKQYFEINQGDHHVFIVDVIDWKYSSHEIGFLTTASLF